MERNTLSQECLDLVIFHLEDDENTHKIDIADLTHFVMNGDTIFIKTIFDEVLMYPKASFGFYFEGR